MPLTREQILSANTHPIEEIEVPEFGGTVLVTGVPMGHERLSAYVNAPVLRPTAPTEDDDDTVVRLGDKATKAEKTAAQTANRIIKAALARQYQAPDEDEILRRRVVGTFILGVVDANGNRIWDWEDADNIRNTLNWNAVNRVAIRIWELSAGASLDEAKSGTA